jgi:hypothetical protein
MGVSCVFTDLVSRGIRGDYVCIYVYVYVYIQYMRVSQSARVRYVYIDMYICIFGYYGVSCVFTDLVSRGIRGKESVYVYIYIYIYIYTLQSMYIAVIEESAILIYVYICVYIFIGVYMCIYSQEYVYIN